MKLTALILPALCAMLALPVLAQSVDAPPRTGPVVVELYTSQGCSSCPPADEILRDLTGRKDVLPLALHVDYWDYIGWKDQFADPAHALRQKGYAQTGGRKMVYTPQMIVMGKEDVVGAKAMKLADLITHYKQTQRTAGASIVRSGSEAVIVVSPFDKPLNGRFDIQLVRYAPLRHIEITRGENAGRALDYANVVDSWQVVATWDGQGPLRIDVPLPGDYPAAVLVQHVNHGRIVATAQVD